MSFTLMPFLYQTRTILRIPPHRASIVVVRSLHTTSRRPSPRERLSTIPFDYEIGAPDDEPAPEESRGTITPTERRIFERIFADIEARGLQSTPTDDSATATAPSRSAMLIMQQAAYEAGQGRPATVTSPAVLSGAAKDRAKALLRFPPPLRGAASKALDTIISQATKESPYTYTDENSYIPMSMEKDATVGEWQAPAHSAARTFEVEAKRYPERMRIEGLITSAKSDFELWDILEKEVFTLPARLGIAKTDSPAEVKTKVKRSSRKRATTTKEKNSESTEPKANNGDTDSDEPEKLSLYVHGPLYPAYLLLALRRLDTAFHRSSPLVFSILPRIKQLGLESYVLGVSTPFLNDLLEIYWQRQGDLSGMLNLLEEMRHCGLYFDKRTASILNRAQAVLSDLSSTDGRSGFGRALMEMPEYENSQRSRIQYWHKTVDMSAQEKVDDIPFVETVDMRR
ncbi:hypothetical protein GGS21DRAFT_103191 [Xylaria nigripes]|nr:hypothetical protein GGS21DRAFT_103191 [Xylaria nigripes]